MQKRIEVSCSAQWLGACRKFSQGQEEEALIELQIEL